MQQKSKKEAYRQGVLNIDKMIHIIYGNSLLRPSEQTFFAILEFSAPACDTAIIEQKRLKRKWGDFVHYWDEWMKMEAEEEMDEFYHRSLETEYLLECMKIRLPQYTPYPTGGSCPYPRYILSPVFIMRYGHSDSYVQSLPSALVSIRTFSVLFSLFHPPSVC